MAASVSLCQGYDRVFGNVRNVAVKGSGQQQPQQQPSSLEEEGLAVEMRYKVCQSLEEVRATLQIDPSSVLGFFEAGSHISHKLQFLSSLNLTTHSLAIVIFAQVITGSSSVMNAALSVAAPQAAKEAEEFVRVYGDSYVTKVVMGAEYYAGFTYHAMSSGEKMDLLAKMKADGLFSWGSGHATVQNNLAKFNSSCNDAVSMEFFQSLRGISGVELPDSAHLLSFVTKLPTIKINKPQILRVEHAGYEHVQSINACYFAPIIRNRHLIVEDAEFLSSLSQVKCLESDVQAIEAVLHRYGMYKGSIQSYLNEVKGAIKADRAAIQIMMQDYRGNVMDEKLRHPLELKSLAFVERVQSSCWREEKSKFIGGAGGDVRKYVTNVQKFISSSRRIVSIQLRAEDWIDRIIIKYSNNDIFDWGGACGGGKWSSILQVPEGVYFAKIRMKDNGQFVSYLQFVLTDGSSLCGGNVKSGGGQDITYEPYKAPHYSYFCGFQARTGGYVNALRVILAEFHI